MKKSRRIVKKMSKKSLINKKALRYIIANSNLCKHAIREVVDRNIETMVESKAKSFVNELRERYDMAFAAFIVDNMRKQNMLKDEKIAELLKDNPDER